MEQSDDDVFENIRYGQYWKSVHDIVTDSIKASEPRLAVMALASGLAAIVVQYRSPNVSADVLSALASQVEIFEAKYQRERLSERDQSQHSPSTTEKVH